MTDTRLPPGPKLPSLVQVAQFIHDRLGVLERCAERYGEFFTLRFPWETLVFTWNPEAVKQVFSGDPGIYFAGQGNNILRPFLGDSSVLLLDGAEHLRQRRLLLPPFHGERMRAYADVIRDVTLAEIDRWPRGRAFPIHPAMQEITLEVIMRAVFGMESGDRHDSLRAKLKQLLDEGARSILVFLPFLQFDLGGLTPYARFKRQMAAVDRLLFDEIAERRANGNGDGRSDILSMMLQAVDEDGKPMTPQELRDELLTLLVAGHETSATSLAWVFYYLLSDPQALERAREEMRRVVGEEAPSAGHLPELRYVDAVIKETARLRPIIVFVARALQQPVDLCGHRLPAGVTVAPCIYLTQRRADLYPEPERFRPERFLDGKQMPYEYFPFGGGVRRCLGMAFAQYEMKVVLATVLSRCSLALPPDSDVRPVRRAVTLAPSDGTRVVVS
ncbi:MAG TPA: cytochrome P450, partial [Candidatus Binatia bacterium]|nr:cytochrome P450 [Candidatus Binatia bacterium]